MARILLLIALCVLPALVSAGRLVSNNKVLFHIQGTVRCDPCRAGFETEMCYPISGALVRAVCSHRQTGKVLYSKDGHTDKEGNYMIPVTEDHDDQLCDAFIVRSPDATCHKKSMGRERARVILTNANGIASDTRYANAMLFETAEPQARCADVMKQYQETEEDM